MFVGINEYYDRSWNHLRFAEADATGLAKIFQEPVSCGYDGGHIDLFVPSAKEGSLQPTFGNIVAGVQRLAKNAGPDDVIIFGFFGHGTDFGESYIFPVDGFASLPKTAIQLEWIRSTLEASEARAKILIFDACQSGTLNQDDSRPKPRGNGFGRSIDLLARNKGWSILTACGRHEKSWEFPEKGHGGYTHFLIEALSGEADTDDDGVITIDDIWKYTSLRTRRWANANGWSQNPELRQNVDGDIALIVRESKAAKSPPPVIAVIGTKGGVGKGTVIGGIAQLIADLYIDVAIVDFDIETCGTTQEAVSLFPNRCVPVKTVIDHLAPFSSGLSQRLNAKPESLWDITPEHLAKHGRGHIWLLPAADLERELKRFNAVANIPPTFDTDSGIISREERLLALTQEILARVTSQVPAAQCILIDCGAGRNPIYHAAMAVATFRYIVTLPDGSFFREITSISQEFQELFPEKVTIFYNVVNRVTSQLDRARVEPLHPVGMIPLDPLAEQDRFAGGSIDYDLGYNEIFLALRDCLEKTVGLNYPTLVPDEFDVRIKPWWARLVESRLAKRTLSDKTFRRTTLIYRLLLALSLTLTVLLVALAFMAYNVIPLFIVATFALVWTVIYVLPQERKLRLLRRIDDLDPKSAAEHADLAKILMSRPDRQELRWLRELVQEDRRREKRRRQKRS